MRLFKKLFSGSKNPQPNRFPPVEENTRTDVQKFNVTDETNPNPFPTIRYNNLEDLFNNIYSGSSKQYLATEKERSFINKFIKRLEDEHIPCECLLSRLSNGELVVYYKTLEIGRFKFNGSRNYLVVYARERRQYESKSDNFYLLKMNYWIDYIKNNCF